MHFSDPTTYVRKGNRQEPYLSMGEIPNHVLVLVPLLLALHKNGQSLEEFLCHLVYKYGNPPLVIFVCFP